MRNEIAASDTPLRLPRSFERVPGWFRPIDRKVFRWLLSTQIQKNEPGDIAELGVYLGKSAILMGQYLRPDEQFVVVDLFEASPSDAANGAENETTYPRLTRSQFEANYLRFHTTLPKVVHGHSQDIVEYARAGRHRFVHVDASHLYEHVRDDIEAARALLAPHGVVVFDDFREAHTPGVAAAVWEAVAQERLHVLLMSEYKLYATKSDPEEWRRRLDGWMPDSGLDFERQDIRGEPALRAWGPKREPIHHQVARTVLPARLLSRALAARARRRGAL